MRRMRFAAKGAAVALVAALSIAAAGDAVTLDMQSYYAFSVGALAVDSETLSTAAAANGYAVLAFSGNTVTVIRGTDSPTDTVGSMLLSADRLLVLDGDRFCLRADGVAMSYALRPADGGLELIVSPKTSIELIEALMAVLMELQDIGIGGMDVDLGSYRTIVRNPFKGPAEPQDLSATLDYALYGLVVAEDWFAYAAQKGIALLGLRLEVVVEKIPGASLPAAFATSAVSETERLASLVVPVDQLTVLARSAGVGYVRLPYVPAVP
jgi:hypothetical protein